MVDEIDVLLESPHGLQAVEIKSDGTFASDWIAGLCKWQRIPEGDVPPAIVFGGDGDQTREEG